METNCSSSKSHNHMYEYRPKVLARVFPGAMTLHPRLPHLHLFSPQTPPSDIIPRTIQDKRKPSIPPQFLNRRRNMSSNVGLNTPRGSGTSGYVQRNLSHLRPRDNGAGAPYGVKDFDSFRHRQRQPDEEILEHDRKREIEVKVFELRDRLEDEECVGVFAQLWKETSG